MNENHILLVEDNPDDELLALRAFKKSNISHRIEVARDGSEAVNYLFRMDQAQSLPKVVLLDLQLPKMSGFDVLKAIREYPRTQLLPVVILTSSDEQRDMIESYRLGANSFIRKPVDFTQFTDLIGQLVAYWMTMNLTPGNC
ncbi:MAG: response regulator [Candidatus Thiodiazotropha taylori]|nr:response regulator [Candidatus Thiodiazotropha taylori]MCG7962451.1 response regulator [Candidatus Thiodiazotropha endolucinida]RLW51585.1 MAG: two-component system response regulator [gamma proteobacterium symbiont of Stewartia floridana]MCG7911552.1 response regulator [Candidatus Thiodiazotropha taylori]MCG7917352.1 response regulator [Candidatus Thiodiazotropha taylori]